MGSPVLRRGAGQWLMSAERAETRPTRCKPERRVRRDVRPTVEEILIGQKAVASALGEKGSEKRAQ